MTLSEIVERERRLIARRLTFSATALIAAGAFALLIAAIFLLGESRWLALPRALPFVVWAAVLLGLVFAIRFVTRRRATESSVPTIAHAFESEHHLRDGALRGALEVSERGALGRFGAE